MQQHARYIMDRSSEDRQGVLNTGVAAASIPWHVRGADGAPLLLDKPGADIVLQQYYQNMPAEKVIRVSENMQYPWKIDNAHRPCAAFLPALLSGMHPFFIEQQVFSACAALNTVQSETRGPASLWLNSGQGRDWCWSMRDVLLAHSLLKRLPPMPWLPAPERFARILGANLDRALYNMRQSGSGDFGIFWLDKNIYEGAPNPTLWAAKHTNSAIGLYQSPIPDFIGYILEWGRRLNGDARFAQLQQLFAQRYQARRLLMFGPYAMIPLPVRLGGRWARDWADVAARVKITPAMRDKRWHKFILPIQDTAIFPYDTEYPLNLYHSLKFAAAAGKAGPEVAAAILALEKQMGPDTAEVWPAFAMRHDS
jgi:hypothetical protein